MKYLLPLAFALLTTSCLEKPTISEEKGPEAASSTVFQAIALAWGDVDPSTIRKGEFSYKEKIQTIQGGSPYLVLQEGVTVDSRAANHEKKQVDYVFLQQLVETVDGQPTSSTKSYSLSTALPDEESNIAMLKAQDVKIQSLVFGIDIVASLAGVCAMTEDLQKDCRDIGADSCSLSCHNLKVYETVVAAPELVQRREDCGGLTDCKMRKKNVSFDWVLDVKRGASIEQQKVTYSVSISPDAPYLSRLMNYCYRGVVQVPNSAQRVLVTICNEVKDFKIGEPYCDKVEGCPSSISSVQ